MSVRDARLSERTIMPDTSYPNDSMLKELQILAFAIFLALPSFLSILWPSLTSVESAQIELVKQIESKFIKEPITTASSTARTASATFAFNHQPDIHSPSDLYDLTVDYRTNIHNNHNEEDGALDRELQQLILHINALSFHLHKQKPNSNYSGLYISKSAKGQSWLTINTPRFETLSEIISKLSLDSVGLVDKMRKLYYTDDHATPLQFLEERIKSLNAIRTQLLKIAYMQESLIYCTFIAWFLDAAAIIFILIFVIITYWPIQSYMKPFEDVNAPLAFLKTFILFAVGGLVVPLLLICSRKESFSCLYAACVLSLLFAWYVWRFRMKIGACNSKRLRGYLTIILIENLCFFVGFGFISLWFYFSVPAVGSPIVKGGAFATLHVAAFFWLISSIVIFFLAGEISCVRIKHSIRVISVILGPLLCVLSISYNFHPWSNDVFPQNIFYWLFAVIKVEAKAIWIDIFAPKFCFSFSLIAATILAIYSRSKKSNEKVSKYLNNELNELDIRLPWGGRGKLDQNGDLRRRKWRTGGGGGRDNATIQSISDNNHGSHNGSSPRPSSDDNQCKQVNGAFFFPSLLFLLVKSCRPSNMAMGAAMCYLSCGLATSWQFDRITGIILALSMAFVIGSQMLLNDVYDKAIDRVQKKCRPLASGRVSTGLALSVVFFLFVLSCMIAVVVDIFFLFYVLCVSGLCFLYSAYLKKRCGILANVLSAGLTTSLCFSGLFLGKHYWEIISISLSVMCACIAREIAKDVEDLAGDRLARKGTLPMIFSETSTWKVVGTFIALQVGFSYLPLWLGVFGQTYCILISISNLFLISRVVPSFVRANGKRMATNIQLGVKATMVAYLITYFFS